MLLDGQYLADIEKVMVLSLWAKHIFVNIHNCMFGILIIIDCSANMRWLAVVVEGSSSNT